MKFFNKKYVDGITLLSSFGPLSIKHQKVDMIIFLIERGPKLDRTSIYSYTSLEYACLLQFHDIVTLLLEAGANPNGCDARPLNIVSEKNDVQLVK